MKAVVPDARRKAKGLVTDLANAALGPPQMGPKTYHWIWIFKCTEPLPYSGPKKVWWVGMNGLL